MRLVHTFVPLLAALPLLLARALPRTRRPVADRPDPARARRPQVARPAPRVPRPRPYVPRHAVPPVVDDAEFHRVARRHAPLWQLSYEPHDLVPYLARHRVLGDLLVGCTDLDALDFTLTEFTPPGYARAYLGHHR
ncbi:hypothetical protein [Thermobifida cellulosilytica]|uniref:Secreted protein n=1 Tax=Thermobifida cellulosilytica TB100 TaxID=665004 RepID=A0A147KER2_THECS|nr:hypothetical protein [Thermobifida cellulosilytica]KUP95791.1 hypothetical protein AC529_15650 [Thermobifida cellulosilytica TB100]